MALSFLIIDGYPEQARADLRAAGMKLAAELYAEMLLAVVTQPDYDVLFAGDPHGGPPRRLSEYDGILWTGTNATIYHDEPRVRAMIELGRSAYASGTPQFGTCWGLQMAAVAAGGRVARNPRGREMGIARKIGLTDAGRTHPFMAGKPPVFDAFISHYDEVVEIPEGGQVLASNAFTGVQALAVEHDGGIFWAVQYHPEYVLGEMARLHVARAERLLSEGFVADREELDALVQRMEALASRPERKDLRWQLGIDADLLDDDIRRIEFRNYVEKLVIPTSRTRGR